LLLAFWMILGAYLWVNKRGENVANTNAGPCVVAWELADGDNVIAKSDATFNFGESSIEFKNLDADLKNTINQIGKYLKNNAKKSITVSGYYDKDEKPATGMSYRDLALARANKVKNMLTKAGASPNQLAVIPKMYDEENRANSDCLKDNTLNRGVSFMFGREEGSE